MDIKANRTVASLVQVAFVLITLAMLGLATIVDIPLTSGLGTGVTVVVTVLSCLVYMVAHESTHAGILYVLSRERPSIAVRFPYLSVGSRFFFTRNSVVVVALAPAVVWGIVLTALLVSVPAPWQFTVYVVLILNVAGSAGDYLEAFAAARLPDSAVVQDDGTTTSVFLPEAQVP